MSARFENYPTPELATSFSNIEVLYAVKGDELYPTNENN